ncbi:hypothetical protein CB7_145 [Pectobacterium phage vB_PatM_CB7]|nr:hypothetical protein CB7_145 [Pectobacterium phage vB_PatM_CB7]
MTKIINFHPDVAPDEFNVIHNYAPARELIRRGADGVHTSQMALLDLAWDFGYSIHIWYRTDSGYIFDEFYPGCYVYGKELRKEHSMQRLWVGGALGDHGITGVRHG